MTVALLSIIIIIIISIVIIIILIVAITTLFIIELGLIVYKDITWSKCDCETFRQVSCNYRR